MTDRSEAIRAARNIVAGAPSTSRLRLLATALLTSELERAMLENALVMIAGGTRWSPELLRRHAQRALAVVDHDRSVDP